MYALKSDGAAATALTIDKLIIPDIPDESLESALGVAVADCIGSGATESVASATGSTGVTATTLE